MIPVTGRKTAAVPFGSVFDTVGGTPVLQYRYDVNHVIASSLPKPWWTQLNVLLAYAAHYNPVNFGRSLLRPSNNLYLAPGPPINAATYLITQLLGR